METPMNHFFTFWKKLPLQVLLMLLLSSILITACNDDDDDPEPQPSPTITSISPDAGPVGTQVTITGTNFSTNASDVTVRFGNTNADVTSATLTQIVATVPDGLSNGQVTVTVTIAGRSGSATTDFEVTEVAGGPVLSIASFTPTEGAPGTAVTITGTGFDSNAANNAVYFADSVLATVTNASPTELVVDVPAGAITGPFSVTVDGETVVSAADFTVLPPAPVITSFTPTEGEAGTEITITGENFSTTVSENTVTFFGGIEGTITGANATTLLVEVPQGAQTGPITVEVNGQSVISTDEFTVIVPVPVVPTYFVALNQNFESEIVRATVDQNGNPNQEAIYTSFNQLQGLDVDTDNNEIYWIEVTFDANFNFLPILFKSEISGNISSPDTVLVFPTGADVVDLEVVSSEGKIFWLEISPSNRIMSSNLTGGDQVEITDLSSLGGILGSLTADEMGNNLFFIQDLGENTSVFSVSAAAGSTASSIYNETAAQLEFSDLAFNPNSDSLLIVLKDQTGSGDGISSILRGSTNGGAVDTVYQSNPGATDNPLLKTTAISVDEDNDYLYWANEGTSGGSIFRGPSDASKEPELLFDGFTLNNSIDNGRMKKKPLSISFDL